MHFFILILFFWAILILNSKGISLYSSQEWWGCLNALLYHIVKKSFYSKISLAYLNKSNTETKSFAIKEFYKNTNANLLLNNTPVCNITSRLRRKSEDCEQYNIHKINFSIDIRETLLVNLTSDDRKEELHYDPLFYKI